MSEFRVSGDVLREYDRLARAIHRVVADDPPIELGIGNYYFMGVPVIEDASLPPGTIRAENMDTVIRRKFIDFVSVPA